MNEALECFPRLSTPADNLALWQTWLSRLEALGLDHPEARSGGGIHHGWIFAYGSLLTRRMVTRDGRPGPVTWLTGPGP